MNFQDRIYNDVRLDDGSVWVLSGRGNFDYSDGYDAERYLGKVFAQAGDLRSDSNELDRWIKDWPSEYHLSGKRAQLLSGFDFDRTKKVLEVGGGCGAITRFLGETFDDVVSVEGSLSRARLARLRARGMDNVSIVCGPFHEISFKEKFDIIFCIGVFEYSGSFVEAPDPYDAVLRYFASLLKPDGMVVLAIENQFGLKYFSSSREDHTNRMFEGIEGYPRYGDKTRTFGYDSLKESLGKQFDRIEFYFPYPDYKIPSCVLSERLMNKIDAGELVGKFTSRDYSYDMKPLFDEGLACVELDKNKRLPFFANSFLVFAGKQESESMENRTLGYVYTTDRAREYRTITRFVEHADKSIWGHKRPLHDHPDNWPRTLSIRETASKWESGLSLQGVMARRVRARDIDPGEMFSPCRPWLKALRSLSAAVDGRDVIDGKYLDCIWSNSFIRNDGCAFIDQEWEWHEKIGVNVIVVRAIYCFLNEIEEIEGLHPYFRSGSTKSLVVKIARSMGIELRRKDFGDFLDLESRFYSIVAGRDMRRERRKIELYLLNRSAAKFLSRSMKRYKRLSSIKGRAVSHLFRFLPR